MSRACVFFAQGGVLRHHQCVAYPKVAIMAQSQRHIGRLSTKGPTPHDCPTQNVRERELESFHGATRPHSGPPQRAPMRGAPHEKKNRSSAQRATHPHSRPSQRDPTRWSHPDHERK